MKTVSITIENFLAPCGCACKYCLLQSCKKADGIEYDRGEKLARRFALWGKEAGFRGIPYIIAYCAEYPALFDNIQYNSSVGFIGAVFLQCNGIKIRNLPETDEFIAKLKAAGNTKIDTTFFGNEEYHDCFAARAGDYLFMLRLAKSAKRQGITCAPSVVVTEENKSMQNDLFNLLGQIADAGNIHAFLPDYRGRGYLMEESRLTKKSYETLPAQVKSAINIGRYKTESEWLSRGELPEYTKRGLIVTLRKDNIEMLEQMTCDETVAYVEKLDDDYYRALPTINELAEMYGDKKNDKLYQLRDLFWMWQKRYREENHIDAQDVTDERFCGTIRS